ncbi:MAG: thioredoxin family protein [Succinivibrio sp.]|nr:thioredoxin family protein [Succinivibrio sp.]
MAQSDEDLFTLEGLVTQGAPKTPFTINSEFKDGEAIFKVNAPQSCYVYTDKISFEADKVSISEPVLPKSVEHRDPLGTHQVIEGSFSLAVNVLQSSQDSTLTLSIQGCDAQGVCYPPMTHTLTLEAYHREGFTALEAGPAQADTLKPESAPEQEFTLFICYILGIGLVLTPCVLPMLSIYSAMIVGLRKQPFLKSLSLNLSYLAGLSLSFALLGLIFARVGLLAQGILQHPLTLVLLALLLIYCALDCMGLVTLKLPQRLLAGVSSRLARQNQGSLRSAFLFGVLSSVLATPCTSAPLAGGILYILHSGDVLQGTLMFLLIGLGMGTPLVLIGLFGAGFLPKSGALSELVHRLLAIPLIYAAFYITEHLFGSLRYTAQLLLISALLGYTLYQLLSYLKLRRALSLTLCALLTLLSCCLLPNVLQKPADEGHFITLHRLEELKAYQGQPLLVTFSAQWCHNCHALDRELYAGAAYQKLTEGMPTLRFDVTDPKNPDTENIIARFKLSGVPQLYLIDKKGAIAGGLSGLYDLDKLKALLERVKQ